MSYLNLIPGTEGENFLLVIDEGREGVKNWWKYSYRPLVGKGKPSRAQATWGVGFPAAEHFSDTAGPGWRVCSMKE